MAMAAMASASSSSSATGAAAACAGDGGHQELHRVKLMCSYGGRILPRPHDNSLRYVGGESRIVVVSRSIDFSDLFSKLSGVFGSPVLIKYQLPSEDLDALISVTCEEDLQNMMEEYDKLQQICAGNRSSSSSSSSSSRLRVFLFPLKLVNYQHQSSRSQASRPSFMPPQYIHTNSSSNPIPNPNHLHPPWPALDADLKSGMHLQRSASETRKVSSAAPDFSHCHDNVSSETFSYSHGHGKVSSETTNFVHHGHGKVLSETPMDYNSHVHENYSHSQWKVPLETQEYLSQSHVKVPSVPSNAPECSNAPSENQDQAPGQCVATTGSSSQKNTDFNLFGSLLQHYSAGSGTHFSNLKSTDADLHKMYNASSGLKTSPNSGGLSDADCQKVKPNTVRPQASSEDIIVDLSDQMKPAYNPKDVRSDIDAINQVKLSSGKSGGISNVQVKPHAPGHKVWPEVVLDLNLDTIHISGNVSPQKSGTRSPDSTDKRAEGAPMQINGDVNSFSRTPKISSGVGEQLHDGDKNPSKAFVQSEERQRVIFNNGLHEDASQVQPAFIGDPIFDEEDTCVLELPQNLLMLDLEDQPLPSVTSPSSDMLVESGTDDIFSISSVQPAGVIKTQKEEIQTQKVSIEPTQDLLLKLDIEEEPHIHSFPDLCNVSSSVMATIPPPLIASSQPFIQSSTHLAAASRPSPVPVVLPHALSQSKITVSSPLLTPIDIRTTQQPPIAVIDVNAAHQRTYELPDVAHFWRQSSDPPSIQLHDIIGQQNSNMWHHQSHLPVENTNSTRFIPLATPISEGVPPQPVSMLGGVPNKKALEQFSTAQYILPTMHDPSKDFVVGGIKSPLDGYMPGTANPFMDRNPHQDLFQQPVPDQQGRGYRRS